MHANKCIAFCSDLLVLLSITRKELTAKYRVLSWFFPLRMLGRTWMKLCTAGLQKPARQKVTHVVDVRETCPLLVRWAPKCICMHLSKQQFSKRKQNSTPPAHETRSSLISSVHISASRTGRIRPRTSSALLETRGDDGIRVYGESRSEDPY